jgi:hypothetical protein
MKVDEDSRLIVWVLLSNHDVVKDGKVANKSWGVEAMQALL